MIKVLSQNKVSKEVIQKAFFRSFSNIENMNQQEIYCFISPSTNDEIVIKKLIHKNSKILVLGRLSKNLANL